MKKRLFAMTFFTVLIIFLTLSFVSAGVSLICLNEGQTLEFSKCNPNMNDYYCDTTLCQLCVKETNGIYCPENLNSCDVGGCEFLDDDAVVVDDGEPDNPGSEYITLVNPIDEYYYSSSKVFDFTFKISDSSKFQKCELILNGNSVAVKNAVISLATQKLSTFVNYGKNKWYLKCTKRSTYGSDVEISEIRDLLIGEDALTPDIEIELVSPEDNSATTSQSVTFTYRFSDIPSDVDSCKLKINGSSFSIDVSDLGLENTHSQAVSPGEYNWNIECIINQETVSSESFSLIISESTTPPSTGGSPGGGGSGGGGGSPGGGGSGGGVCTTEWQCSEWSECEEDIQTRTCVKKVASCTAGEKPIESRECVLGQEDDGNNNEDGEPETTETSENILQKGFAGITGAVVGVGKNKGVGITLAVVFLLIAAGLFFFQYKKVKK